MAASAAGRTIFKELKEFLIFRSKRLYNTFYYGQYSAKFTLVLLLPAAMSAIRYRAETKFGYHIFLADEAIEPEPHSPKWIPAKALGLDKYFLWKNGTKFYCNDTTTVKELKEQIYGGKDKVPGDIGVGCKGRMFEESDNLALVVRSFCQRDARLHVWKEDWKQQVLTEMS